VSDLDLIFFNTSENPLLVVSRIVIKSKSAKSFSSFLAFGFNMSIFTVSMVKCTKLVLIWKV